MRPCSLSDPVFVRRSLKLHHFELHHARDGSSGWTDLTRDEAKQTHSDKLWLLNVCKDDKHCLLLPSDPTMLRGQLRHGGADGTTWEGCLVSDPHPIPLSEKYVRAVFPSVFLDLCKDARDVWQTLSPITAADGYLVFLADGVDFQLRASPSVAGAVRLNEERARVLFPAVLVDLCKEHAREALPVNPALLHKLSKTAEGGWKALHYLKGEWVPLPDAYVEKLLPELSVEGNKVPVKDYVPDTSKVARCVPSVPFAYPHCVVASAVHLIHQADAQTLNEELHHQKRHGDVLLSAFTSILPLWTGTQQNGHPLRILDLVRTHADAVVVGQYRDSQSFVAIAGGCIFDSRLPDSALPFRPDVLAQCTTCPTVFRRAFVFDPPVQRIVLDKKIS